MPQEKRRGDPSTRELKQAQEEKATGEHEAIEASETPDEAHQHDRRAAKSAYLARKLAERERSEREARGDDESSEDS
jgi:hypothetical protein